MLAPWRGIALALVLPTTRGLIMVDEKTWLTVPEAAEHCRCSVRAFLNMHLPANDAGGRKVYHREALDAAIMARTWRRSTNSVAGLTVTADYGALSERLIGKRRRPYKPRKKPEPSV